MKHRGEPEDALAALPEAQAACVRACVAAELEVFERRLHTALLREVVRGSDTPPPSQTTSVRAPGALPEALPLDGLRRDAGTARGGAAPSSTSAPARALVSVQVRGCHVVPEGPGGARTAVYTVAAACAGGYHATVYRRAADAAALHRQLGRRAGAAPFAAPTGTELADTAALARSCTDLRRLLCALTSAACASAQGSAALLAWLGLDRALAHAHNPADAALDAAAADVWRAHYSDAGAPRADTPEAAIATHLETCALRALGGSLDVGTNSEATTSGATKGTKTTKTKATSPEATATAVHTFTQETAGRVMGKWRARATDLVERVAALPMGAYADALEDALGDAPRAAGAVLAPFLAEALPLLRRVLRVLTPLVKAVRHTVREYRPRVRATLALLLAAPPGTLRGDECDALRDKLARVKAKVKGAADYVAHTYLDELALLESDDGAASGGGDGSDGSDGDLRKSSCKSSKKKSKGKGDSGDNHEDEYAEYQDDQDSFQEDQDGYSPRVMKKRLLALLRKLPTLVSACFYQLQPAVAALFVRHLLAERDRLCASTPAPPSGRGRNPADVLAEHLGGVLPLVERDLSFAAACVPADIADEAAAAHRADAALPPSSALAALLRAFHAACARATAQHVRMYANIARIFAAAAAAPPLATATAPAVRAELCATAARRAVAEGVAMLERHAARALPRTLTELGAALLLGPARVGLGAHGPALALALGRTADPALRGLLDDAGLVETALVRVLRAAVAPLVRDWLAALTRRPSDPARTALAVALRRQRRQRERSDSSV